MRGGLKHKADARVTVLLTDPSDFSKKELKQLTTFDQISSSLSMDGIGTATISFSNKRLSFFNGIKQPAWAQEVEGDLKLLKKAAELFKMQTNDMLSQIPIQYIEQGKVLLPLVNPYDLIWIDYRGKDGVWYPGFTGIITGFSDKQRAKSTPSFTIHAKDYRRLMQTTPVVYGLNNIADFGDLETILTGFQKEAILTTNIFHQKEPSTIINMVLNVINKMLNIQPKDLESFWNYRGASDRSGFIGLKDQEKDIRLFSGAKVLLGALITPDPLDKLIQDGERSIQAYNYDDDAEFDVWAKRRENNTVAIDYYHNPLGWAFHDKIFKDGPSVYQTILRSQLDLFNIDQESAYNILNKVAQATFSSIYVDQAGNLRYEYPRYETMPSLAEDPTAFGLLNGAIDIETPWHARNYWVSSTDNSFQNYNGGFNEGEIVATRVTAPQQFALSPVKLGEIPERMRMTGYATLPESDLLRYGLREANLAQFFSNTTLDKTILDSFAKAALTFLNVKGRSFVVVLNQRPDTMLNRNMVYMDRMLVGLITDISDTFSPVTGHQRTHTCRYMRYVGEELTFPWRELLQQPIDDNPGPEASGIGVA